ncbi:MAG: hypothetical protein IJZ03_07315 [Clostridia bacterium]|nr:hypothetical protein [Clostridia bacterium]
MSATKRFPKIISAPLRIAAVSALLISMLICFAFVTHADSEAKASSDIDIEMSFDKEVYSKGDTVIIMLAVTNNTGKKIENVSARYYLPSCLEVSTPTTLDLGIMNSRQTVRTQIQAKALSDISRDMIENEDEKESNTLYITLLIISAAVFLVAVVILIFRERSRRKVAAAISICLAIVFMIAPMANRSSASDTVVADSIAFSECQDLFETLAPDTVDDLQKYITHSGDLTREKAAFLLSVMTLGANELPKVTSDPYTDVSADSAYAPFIAYSVEKGLIPSISATKFYPANKVSGYDFLTYTLRAIGLGANGEYLGQNGRANVIYDALRLPFAEASELLEIGEGFVSCSRALSIAVKAMTIPCAELSQTGTYTLSSPSLITSYGNIASKKALAIDKNTLLCDGGELLKISYRTLDHLSYNVFSSESLDDIISGSSETVASAFTKLYVNGEETFVGVGIQPSVSSLSDAYSMRIGNYNEDTLVLTSDNIHFRIGQGALKDCKYMLDSRTVDVSEIDYEKPITVIIRSSDELVSFEINEILYVYQLSSNDPASYDAYNAALQSAKAIKNEDSKIYLPSAYDEFLSTIEDIDASLSKTLTDTEESRKLISDAEHEILNAIAKLSENKLVSYDALDAEIKLAEPYVSKDGSYTPESFEVFMLAYEEATSLSRELIISEENEALVSSTAEKLKKAVEELVFSDYCDYSEYQAALDSALAIKNDNGKFTDKNFKKFTDAVNAVKKDLATDLPRNEENQKKVDDAAKKIKDAIADLNATLPCDYSALDSALAQASNINNDNFQWTSGSFAEFTEALTAAKAIKRNMTVGYGSTNQSQINSAASFLRSAISTLTQNSLCDYKEFNKALEAARAVTNNEGTYDAAAFGAYLETVDYIDENLDKALFKASVNEAKITQAIKDLEAAKARLEETDESVLMCDMNALLEILASADSLSDEDLMKFSARTVDAFKKAKSAANALVEGGLLANDIFGFNQKKIDDTAKALKDAMDSLAVEEIFTTQVVDILKESKDGDEKTYKITLLYRAQGEDASKATEFTVSEDIAKALASAKIGDVLYVTTEDGMIVSASIIIPEVKTLTQDTDLSGYATSYFLSYEEYIPEIGGLAVFFISPDGEILFVTEPRTEAFEVTVKDGVYTVNGEDLILADDSVFDGIEDGTPCELTFGGIYLCRVEALTALEEDVSLDTNENAVYKKDGEPTVIEPSALDFTKANESELIIMSELISALKKNDAPYAYTATLWLDSKGALVACKLLGPVEDDGSDAEIVDQTYYFSNDSDVDNFKIHGRTTPLAEGIACDTSASGVEFNAYIEGELKIRLSVSQNCYFTLYIDGERVEERINRLPADNGKEFVLASFSDKKVHNIRLLKQTEAQCALSVLQSISFKGYFEAPPEDKELLIEVLGDSITVGFGNLCERDTPDSGSAPYQDATQTYGFLAAEKLNADVSLVCYSGIGVSIGWPTFLMEEYFKADSYLRDKNTEFVATRTPDVVVINLGTNDQMKGIDIQKLKTKVKALVDLVRETYKTKIPIVWMHGMMEKASLDKFNTVFNELYKDADQSLVYFFQVAQENQGGGGHPSLDAHYDVGEELATYLEENILNK